MKRLLKVFFVAVVMGFLSFGPAEAQYQGGGELYEMCFGEGRFQNGPQPLTQLGLRAPRDLGKLGDQILERMPSPKE